MTMIGYVTRAAGCLGAALLALATIGCDRHPSGTAEVSGRVTLDGQPLAGAEVELVPQANPELGGHTATTDSDGAFTVQPPSGSNNPLRPGQYVVLVRKLRSKGNDPNQPGGGMGAVVDEVPAVYHDRARSPFVADVHDGENTLPTFDVKTRPETKSSPQRRQ